MRTEMGEENPLQKYVASYRTIDMLDFSKAKFDKLIKTTLEHKIKIDSKYPLKKLEEFLIPIIGETTKIAQNEILDEGQYPVITQETDKIISGYTNNNHPITDLPLVVFGDHSCNVKYIDFEFVRGADGTQLIKTSEELLLKYLFNYLQSIKIHNAGKYERHFKYLKETPIPLPPIDIQQQIIGECGKIDEEHKTARMSIDDYRKKIAQIFENLRTSEASNRLTRKRLGELYKISSGGTPSRKVKEYWENGSIPWLTTGELQNRVIYDTLEKITQRGLENSSAKIFPKDSIVIAMYGMTVGYSAKLGIEATTNQACAVLYEKKTEIETDYVWFCVKSQPEKLQSLRHGTSQPNLNANDVANFEIPVPSISEQQSIVTQIEQYEAEIRKAQAIMDGCATRKKAILEKYLN